MYTGSNGGTQKKVLDPLSWKDGNELPYVDVGKQTLVLLKSLLSIGVIKH